MSYLRSGGGASERLKSGGSGRLPSLNSDRTDKFTRLKAVLVGNLLKEYHRASKDSSHDEVVYQMALQEVDTILRRGKLTEQELKRLQHRFATEVPQRLGIKVERTEAQLAQSGPAPAKKAAASGLPPQPPPPRLNLENMSQTGSNMSPSKLERPVDEWTVMILYNDVQHIEEERKKAEKIRAEKDKTRQASCCGPRIAVLFALAHRLPDAPSANSHSRGSTKGAQNGNERVRPKERGRLRQGAPLHCCQPVFANLIIVNALL